MATNEEIRAKDILPHNTAFSEGDGFYGDGDSSFFMEASKLLELTAQNAQRTKTILSNGSCGNYGNAYGIVTYKVIPTNGADYVRVGMNVPLDEGETYEIDYCFFKVDSGIVPSNAPGAVPSAQRTGVTEIYGTEGFLDIEVPEGYIGIGFAFFKKVGGSSVSIQDATHKSGATYSLLYLPEEVNEKFAQIDNKFDEIVNKFPVVSTVLKNGSCGNAYNSYAIVTWNVIPINGATHFRVTMNQTLPEGYSYGVDYCFFKVDSGIVPSNAPDAVPSAQRTGVYETLGVTDHLDIEIREGYIGIGFAWWLKDENGQNVSIHDDAHRNGVSFARLYVPDQITDGIAGNYGLIADLNGFCGDLDFVDSILTLANGSKPNPSNAYAVHGEYNKNLNRGDIVRVRTDVVTDENAVFEWDIYEYINGSPVYAFSTTYDAANRAYDYTIHHDGIDQVSFVLLGRIGSSTGERITFRVATFDGRITCGYSLKSSLNSRLSALESGTITAYNRNAGRAIELNAACRRSKSANDSKDFQLLIVTDVHQDTVAEDNAIDMANNFDSIACVFNCGDEMASFYNISNPAGNSVQYADIISMSQKPYFFAIGNHEAGTFNFIQYCPTSAMMYESFIKPLVDKGFIGVGEYETDKCYYYHDFTTEKIRLVVLNEYDSPLEVDDTKWTPVTYDSTLSNIAWNTSYEVGDKVNVTGYTDYSFECKVGLTTPSSIYDNTGDVMPRYKLTPGYRYIGQTQAQWFLDTLEDTPADYSVIVMLHNPFSDLAVVENKKFSQPSEVGKYGSAFSQNNMSTDFIADAVHAFMTKDASYSQVVTMKNGTTYSVSKDFSSVASGVKFLCYIGGHSHRDLIWRHSVYTEQWQVSPVCANSTNYAQYTGADIRRTTQDGYAKDSVTCVAFNVADREIRLSKLGVNITEDMTYRDFEKIGLS